MAPFYLEISRERQASDGSSSLPDLVHGIQPVEQDRCSSKRSSFSGSREALAVGVPLSFRVIIHQAWSLPSECDDVFCQFKYACMILWQMFEV